MITQDGTLIVPPNTGKTLMPRDKIKPPAETKAQLMTQVNMLLQRKYQNNESQGYEFLLNFFTSADLVGIRDELKK